MQAYELKPIQSLDSLTLVERPDPRPGPGQVLLEMRAWSLNFRDLSVARGAYGGPPPAGRIPLSDGVGIVREVGPGVARVKAGDRVAGIFMQGWIAGGITADFAATALGGAIDGMLAEQVVLSEQGVVKVPDHLSDEEAAALPCAAVTAWNALVREGASRAAIPSCAWARAACRCSPCSLPGCTARGSFSPRAATTNWKSRAGSARTI